MNSESIFGPFQTSIVDALRDAPESAGILAVAGALEGKPYLAKVSNIRRRLQRLLRTSLNSPGDTALIDRVSGVAWRETGSDFESNLLLYRAYQHFFSLTEARKRMKLRAPYFVRLSMENEFPRLFVTNRLSRRHLPHTYGPFSSRGAAERYVDALHELYPLRRCHENLHPDPEHPGCIYGEINKCNAPCQIRVSQDAYRDCARQVEQFLATGGQSELENIAVARDRASAEMEFEAAAAAHGRFTEVKAVADLAGPLAHAVSDMQAIIFLPCANETTSVDVWLLRSGGLAGPQRFSTLGVRLAREQAEVGSSLFAQPLMLQPVGLDGQTTSDTPEDRLRDAIQSLGGENYTSGDCDVLEDCLALLKRWYYRPEKKRVGTLCFQENGEWPLRQMVRSAAKAAGSSSKL